MPDPLQPFLEALHATGRLRVWSIVITVFGDVVEHRGGQIALRDLQRITDRIGIGEGALRTAMFRLAKEGWVERQKDGRSSLYRLSADRRFEMSEAAKVIYRGTLGSGVREWALILDEGADVAQALRLSRGAQILPWRDGLGGRERFVLRARAEHVPDWVRSLVVPDAVEAQIGEVGRLLDQLPARLSDLDALVMRVLLVHFWRRAVLRLPEYAADLMPPDWEAIGALARLGDVYAGLWEGSERAIALPVGEDNRCLGRFEV